MKSSVSIKNKSKGDWGNPKNLTAYLIKVG